MSSTNPPQPPPSAGQPPPGYPPARPYYPQQPEGRSVAFWVALLLGLLLVISAILNVILLFVAASGAAGLGGGGASDDAGYRTVVVDHQSEDDDVRILRVPIQGAIAEMSSPVIGAQGGTVSQVKRALRLARRDKTIKGILFDINSPGGGVGDSEEIYRLIREFRDDQPDKKVMALFGDIAASGGYYIAMACEKVLSRRTTITGSIGVIISSYDVSEAMEKIGVKAVTLVSERTPFKDMLSPTRTMRPDEKEKILSIVDEMYDRFVEVVDAGRPNLDRTTVQRLANGQVYSAGQALTHGLIDRIGTAEDAYDELRKLIGIDAAQVVEQRRLPTLGDMLLGAGAKADAAMTGPQLASHLLFNTTGSKFLYFWPGGR